MSFRQHLHPAVIALIARECQGKQRTPAWFLSRGKMLTASEMAAVLGVDKYKSRNQLMKQKLRPIKIQSGDSMACAWGNKYEDKAVAKYESVTGRKVLPFNLIQHPKYTWLGASPDGVSVAENDPTAEPIGLEIKCPFSRKLSTDGIPDLYYPQARALLLCGSGVPAASCLCTSNTMCMGSMACGCYTRLPLCTSNTQGRDLAGSAASLDVA